MTESYEDVGVSATDELDFSDAGIQAAEVLFAITAASVSQKANGTMAIVALTALEPGILSFPVTETFWITYTNPETGSKQAEDIGRSNLKKLFTAVYGTPNGSIDGLVDHYVIGWLKEDKNSGMPTVGRFKAPTEAQIDAAMEAANA